MGITAYISDIVENPPHTFAYEQIPQDLLFTQSEPHVPETEVQSTYYLPYMVQGYEEISPVSSFQSQNNLAGQAVVNSPTHIKDLTTTETLHMRQGYQSQNHFFCQFVKFVKKGNHIVCNLCKKSLQANLIFSSFVCTCATRKYRWTVA